MNYTEASSSTQTNNWCVEKKIADGTIVSDEKFVFFLTDFVMDSVVLQKKYPNHYLWISEIFSTSLYQEFEAQHSGAIGESTEKFQVSDHIQVVAPEIAAAMRARFDAIVRSFNTMQAQNQFEFANARSIGLETRNVLVETFLQASFRLCNDPSQIQQCLENVLQTQSPASSGYTAPSVPSVTSASLGPSVPSALSAPSSFTQLERLARERHLTEEEVALLVENKRRDLKISLNELAKRIADSSITF
ncbi:hypothetical protein PHYBLDRAFT_168920 [Phycomyces blakesleeanus NRRL 1555(-)]|uniref:Uncharacterized protein n=1 Tax=Phycomyces blakesleeanus (strain ATCC 8743b / DSM 1359 / FGSC 10004 / NBRC 33097 / NRRL 1555) TaxID=763407 RepID=A0A162U181_PHYB8|nr:hypothetical protein PHYBLDRAFT_168920 [Phycomyces blakesleeanus NRRL 1555(-)]OAD72652.1 hypothetical protein PHYBLDRAFT_168920 [Phycomyces blakesleeanus NRRL 1555(-)]|eukprot:XP_018290692.1 hypothetical protein PHYBLDRAFT_168920 [Phycomyces blakesleeanus NRRL 1555(-)]